MKKAVITLILILTAVSLFACTGGSGGPSPAAAQPSEGQSAAAETTPAPTEDMTYAFEFEDIDGKVHKLSDYKGKPVYLEIWGSWCSVCVSSLPEMNEFAGEEHEFAVLSVITPGVAGEMSKEDFVEWYKSLGYDNLIVLIDEKAQVINDFGVSAYPSQLMFDAKGNFVTGFAGLLPKETIVEVMGEIAQGTYNG